MASKKELQAQIDRLEFQRDAAKRDADRAWKQIADRDRRVREENQRALRAKERERRRQHIVDLGEGRLNLKDASSYAIVCEHREEPYLEVTFPLDGEELSAVQRALRSAPPTINGQGVTATWLDEVFNQGRLDCFSHGNQLAI